MTVQWSLVPPVSFQAVDAATADAWLVDWGHYLGSCERPFGRQDWALLVHGEPVCVATSASTVGVAAAEYARQECVELARLCRHPEARWATRVCLRLWREVGALTWPHWPVKGAVAYSSNDRHEGRIYRFDGWRNAGTRRGAKGGGTWTKPREEGHVASSDKTLWVWDYGERPAREEAA